MDILLHPLYRVNNQEGAATPGLMAISPPRKVARGRESDLLVIYLSLSGNTSFSSGDYAQLVAQAGQRFYQSAGSLTAALRASADAVNQILVERNLASTSKGLFLVGRLILGVLRGSQFILAQSGPTHVFHLGGGTSRQIHDQQIAGRGLGVGQTTPIYFSQLDLNPKDTLLLCSNLPAGWEVLLQAETGDTPLDALRRKLVVFSKDDLNAILVEVQEGKGQISVVRSAKASAEPAAPSIPFIPSAPSNPVAGTLSTSRPETPVKSLPIQTEAVTPTNQVTALEADGSFSSTPLPPSSMAELPEISRESSKSNKEFYRRAAGVIGTGRRLGEKIKQGFNTLFFRMQPGQENKDTPLSGTMMAVIVIAIALIMVTIGMTIYSRIGMPTRYQENMELAMDAFNNAKVATDPAEARRLWTLTIFYVDQAEDYKESQNSQTLRQHAQSYLDALDGIVRLNFQQALIVALDKSVNVTKMAASETDLYLLNSTRGNVMRTFMTNQGYEVDPTFKCEPGLVDGITIGNLIDVAAIPRVNEFNATVIAMDAGGTLLYCTPGAKPRALSLVTPEIGWRKIRGFALDTDNKNLYVLDPQSNAVWGYTGDSLKFDQLPFLFFGEQIPQSMDTAIDLAANGDDLFLLFEDGHITACTMSRMEVAPTRCSDPLTMMDTRLQHQPGPTITDATFTVISFASPPDPSLYMMEPNTQAVYRFSPRSDGLLLQGQFRATVDVAEKLLVKASAFALSPNRYLFICVGNQVYYATDVP